MNDEKSKEELDLRELQRNWFSWRRARQIFLIGTCIMIPIYWIKYGNTYWTIIAPPIIAIGGIIFVFWSFLPSFISYRKNLSRKHNNWVVILNFLIGWTIIGWIIALLLALHKPETKREIENVEIQSNRLSSGESGT